MEPLEFSDVQAQLVRCQEVLDTARQEGWSPELVAAFDEATRTLHEGAVIRKALQGQPSPQPAQEPEDDLSTDDNGSSWDAAPEEPAVNRLLTAEEKGDPAPLPESQVDLLSSIGEMTLAEKLALQPLADVADGMSILDRVQFTSVLFSEKRRCSAPCSTNSHARPPKKRRSLNSKKPSLPRGEESESKA